MKAIRDRVAGLDIHKDSVVACAQLRQGPEVAAHKRRFGTTTAQVAELAEWLADLGVTTVAMEATGVYWKPIYYGLEGLFEELWLCNAQHVKNVPGRKTDMADAEWLADVAAHGMVRPSVVPEPAMREVRELTRYRKSLVDERVRESPEAGKGTPRRRHQVVVGGLAAHDQVGPGHGGSADKGRAGPQGAGRAWPRARCARNPPPWNEALVGRFSAHHAVVARQSWPTSTSWTPRWPSWTKRSGSAASSRPPSACSWRCRAGAGARPRCSWPRPVGTWPGSPRAAHLASWCRICPANNESAGRHKAVSQKTGQDLARAGAHRGGQGRGRSKGTYFGAQYRQVPAGAARTKRPSPWPTPWSSPPGTSSPPGSTTTTSGRTISAPTLTPSASRNASSPTCATSAGPSPPTQTAPSPSPHPS